MALGPDARWQTLYAAHRPSLYRTAALLVGEAEAEEVVQDAFERAMREPEFFSRVIEPAAWLRTATTRVALGRLRRRVLWDRVRSLVAREPPVADGRNVDLEAALRELPPRQRAAVVLRYYQDAPYSEIAEALEIEEASVGPLLTRARAALRESLR